MIRKQNISFVDYWEKESEGGFGKYCIKHFGGSVSLMLGVFLGTCIGNKEINITYLIISLLIAGLFPSFAWIINEIRMKTYRNNYKK